MNTAFFTLLKKELKRFFGDKRIVINTIFLPGIMIFAMYTLIGNALTDQFSVDEEYKYKIEAKNLPVSMETVFGSAKIDIDKADSDGLEGKKDKLVNEELDLFMVFPENFDDSVSKYDVSTGQSAPKIEMYFNSAATKSSAAYDIVVSVLDSYEASVSNKFDINNLNGENEEYDVATEKETTGKVFASMLPMLLMMFLVSGCVAVGPESIAGEKERGTFATMLITPAKRSHIAFGKIVALSIIAILSGASSTIGTVASMPMLMQEEGIKASTYGFADYAFLALIIMSTVLIILTLISIISAFAKTTKEAQTYVSPLMVLVVLLGISAMFGGEPKTEFVYYLIPLFNSVQCMIGIFSFKVEMAQILLTVASNLVYSGIGVFVLVKMFNSENIMFRR